MILFETEYTYISQQLLETIPSPITSYTVVNELIFIVIRKAIEKKLGIKNYYEFKRIIVEKGYELVEDYIENVMSILRDADVRMIDDYHDLNEWINVMKNYRLLSNDAQIALTCKYYHIDTIATLDEGII